jgi:hypothetical protein
MHISIREFAEKLSLTLVGDPPTYSSDRRGIADLIRRFVFAEGCVTRRELGNYLGSVFQTLKEFDQTSRAQFVRIADELAELGDFKSVRVGREHGWVRTPFRWIATSPATAVVLGHANDQMTLAKPIRAEQRSDLLRRYSISSDRSDVLMLSDTTQMTIGEWIGRGAWNEHRVRRGNQSVDTSIRSFWECLLANLESSEAVGSEDGSFRLLAGIPGERFGRHNSTYPRGRWTTSMEHPDGHYLASYRARNDNDWRYLLVTLRQLRVVRALTLENSDEFQWALLARGVAQNQPEKLVVDGCDVRLTFPPPRHLRSLLNLLGIHESGWNWQLASPIPIEQLEYWTHPPVLAR